MKIFISWSGEKSRKVAEILKDWIPYVINRLELWISSEDILKGARWEPEISKQLAGSSFGLLCITKDNIDAPWINFEAGALAKTIGTSFVCPILVDIKLSDLRGPLAQFQATKIEENDIYKLLKTMNKNLGNQGLAEDKLIISFKKWWPDLKQSLEKLPSGNEIHLSEPSVRDLLGELLELTRLHMSQNRTAASTTQKGKRVKIYTESELQEFAESITLTGDTMDPNAENWNDLNIRKEKSDSIEGIWNGRWNGGVAGKNWRTGIAKVSCIKNFFCIYYIEGNNRYIIEGYREYPNRLIGKYYNLMFSDDSAPWVGLIVNENRIDGKWEDGRWDLRRNEK